MGSHLGLSGGSWLVPRGGLEVAWHCPPLCGTPSPWDLPQPYQQGIGGTRQGGYFFSHLFFTCAPTCLPVCLCLHPPAYPGGSPQSWAQGRACPLLLCSWKWWPPGAVGCGCLSQGSGTTCRGDRSHIAMVLGATLSSWGQ